jgi:hypothetical protein
MAGMSLYSWLLIPVLMAAFGCGTAAVYRIRHDRTPLALTITGFCLLSFVLLMVYTILINPYPQPPLVTYGFTGVAFVLLLTGVGFLLFIPSAASQRLSFSEVRALLPESISELTPEQMRALLPVRFKSYAQHEIQVLVMVQLTRTAPDVIRNLTPEKLKALMRRDIPHSILDSK